MRPRTEFHFRVVWLSRSCRMGFVKNFCDQRSVGQDLSCVYQVGICYRSDGDIRPQRVVDSSGLGLLLVASACSCKTPFKQVGLFAGKRRSEL